MRPLSRLRRGRHPARHPLLPATALLLLAALAAACGGDDDTSTPAAQAVRERIASLDPANLGHRGTGPTREGHPFPENALSSFAEAIRQGADGIELDVELTADGALVVMHDDRLDRTTDCSGCVSALTLTTVQSCHLLDGNGVATAENPPTLDEVFALLPADAMVNIELKTYGAACRTSTSGPVDLAAAAVAAVEDLGTAHRVLFSSFDLAAALHVKTLRPDFYAALLVTLSTEENVAPVVAGDLDALHPLFAITEDLTRAVLASGAQVNMWTVDGAAAMNASLDKGATAIITDEPAVLVAVLAERRQ